MMSDSREKAAELAKELVGNVQFYETQERWGCFDIAKGWPDVIKAPHTKHGRLKKVLTESLVTKLESAIRAARREAIEEAAKVADGLFNPFHSPYEYAENVSDAIRLTLREEPSE